MESVGSGVYARRLNVEMAAVAHVMTVLGRQDAGFSNVEDAVAANTIGWVILSFALMWLPETFVAPIFGGVPRPS
jgi:hypothetical protein